MDITYSDSAKGVRITHSRAMFELTKHGVHSAADQAGALREAQTSPGQYDAYKLLLWLGY